MENECLYKLRGSVQVIVTKLGNKTMTNHNITNELAEAFLSTNTVNRIAAFQTYPKTGKREQQLTELRTLL
jgi:hypothetical protein